MTTNKKEKHSRIAALVFAILGLILIAYCISIFLAVHGSLFYLTWGVLGVVCLVIARFCIHPLPIKIPRLLVTVFFVCVALGFTVFIAVEGLIISRFHAVPKQEADYMIVLGAQWSGDAPGHMLKFRLDTAVDYLEEHPNLQVIVSGGQGSDETMAEADGMRQYLMAAGIADERIIVENKSTNTYENFLFSRRLVDTEGKHFVVVSNNFHIYRALKLAQKQGLDAEGLAAGSTPWITPNNMVREFVGILKDFLFGNI